MLRLVLWKLLFIALNLGKKWSQNRGKKVWHFAYGANVDQDTLLLRGVVPFSSQNMILENYQFSFSHPGPYQGQGFADIEFQPGSKTFGKLYQISKWDQYRLHLFELALFFDRHQSVWITQSDKQFYFYQAKEKSGDVSPFCAYQDKIVKAYQESKFTIPDYEKKFLSSHCIESNNLKRKDFHYLKKPKTKNKVILFLATQHEKTLTYIMSHWYPHPLAGTSKRQAR